MRTNVIRKSDYMASCSLALKTKDVLIGIVYKMLSTFERHLRLCRVYLSWIYPDPYLIDVAPR